MTDEEKMKEIAEDIRAKFMPDCDFVPTCGGRGQHHPRGYVGIVWRINDPKTVRVGSCFLAGRLKKGDLFLCTEHSGDCFQTYVYVEEYDNCYVLHEEWSFGSYGKGDAEALELTEVQVAELRSEGRTERTDQGDKGVYRL